MSQFEWDTVRACACVGAGSAVPCFDFSPLSVFAWVTCAARGFISDTIDASANWWLSRIKDKEEGERERGREREDSMTLMEILSRICRLRGTRYGIGGCTSR